MQKRRGNLALFAGVAWAALFALGSPAAYAQDALDAAQGRGSIRSLQRVSATDGWVLTDAALLVTHDGGATWSDMAPARATSTLSEAFFLDGTRGFVAALDTDASARGADRLNLLVTQDGGASWVEHALEASALEPSRPYAGATLHFIDGEHGWVLGQVATSAGLSWGELFRTADGGATWVRLPQPPSAGRLVFVDAQRGFLLATPSYEHVYATQDGGASWSEVELPAVRAGAQALYDLPVFFGRGRGALAATVRGANPVLATYATSDAGRTWQLAGTHPLETADSSLPARAAFAAGRLAAVADGGRVTLDPAGTARGFDLRAPAVPEGSRAGVRELSFGRDGSGWALVGEGTCDARGCREATRVVALGGGLAEAPVVLARSANQPVSAPDGSTISTAYGFDKCAAATSSEMQTWKTNSPYQDANIYYGGSARACSQPNLTSSWVTAVFGQGWRLIPTWVGPQAPCSGYGNVFSTNTTTAASQGTTEGTSAVNAASALGIGAGSPLYYDLENYTETDTTCTNAVRAFVNAWVARVKALGYQAGVYGAGPDAQHDWIPGVIANPPDAVWIAHWVCSGGTSCTWTPTVWGLYGLSDSYWNNNQRIRQYWGNHTKTYGGVTFNIDSDYANGPVATSGGGGGYTFTCDDGDGCFAKYGPAQYWHTETTCGGSSLGYGGDMVWTYVNGTTTSNYVRWTPTLSGAGNYTVSVFVPRCFGTSQQAKYRVYANGTSYYPAAVNQNSLYDAWVTLGTYYFAASGTQYLELTDATGEAYSTLRQIAFDAAKFVK